MFGGVPLELILTLIYDIHADYLNVPNVTVSREIFNANDYTIFLDLNEYFIYRLT